MLLHRTLPPIIVVAEPLQAFVKPGSMIYSDGFRGYRRLAHLGYEHKWVNHNKEYVSMEGVHTNRMEGLWGVVKRWLPSLGPYNLEEYLLTALSMVPRKKKTLSGDLWI